VCFNSIVTVIRNECIPFNNQPDALIIQIYSVIKLYMFRASSLPIIRSPSRVRMELQFHPDSA